MGELLVFCERDSLEADYLAEFLAERRVPQNLFYLMNGASSFYSYRNADLAKIAWRDECDFFKRQSFWTRDQSYAFVSLGCGNAGPEKMLLRSMHLDGYRTAYFGVDSSDTMLELAGENLEEEDFPRTFVQADFGRDDFADSLWDLVADYDTRLYAMIGGTFGNFDQAFIADLLSDLVPRGDYLYLDVVPLLQTEELNRRLRLRLSHLPENLSAFFDRLLTVLGLSLDQGKVVCVESGDGDLDTARFTFYFEVATRLVVSCLGTESELLPGERVELLSIRAYDVTSLEAYMARRGFLLVDTYVPDVGDLGHLWQRLLFVKSS